MKIRQATTDDIPAIQRLNRELDKHHADLLPGIFRPVTEDARPDSVVGDWIKDADADYLVAEENGIVGFINIRRASHPRYPMFKAHKFAMIEDAVVEQSVRSRGIGTKLFNAAIAWARERGLEYVQTTVWSANRKTKEFYLDQGFHLLTERLELDLKDRKAEPSTGGADIHEV
jgi:diamine N-acetyltransferase